MCGDLTAHCLPSLRPLPSGKYGVRCFRGPHFEASGFGDDKSGQDSLRAGVTLAPSMLELRRWAQTLVLHGQCGSWSPWTSHVAQLVGDGNAGREVAHESNVASDASGCFYYKAADGAYDLSCDLDGVEVLLADTGGRQLEALGGRLCVDGAEVDGCKRSIAEHKIFDLACQLFIREIMNAMHRAHLALSSQGLDVAVMALASQEVSAWQLQCRSQVHPLTAWMAWHVGDERNACFA